MTDAKILVIDDNTAVLSTLKIVLKSVFKTVVAVSDPQLIPALISAGDVDAVLLDMNFGSDKLDGQDGLFWLDRIMNRSGLENPPAVVMITAFGDVGLAVTSLKKGALDFIQKPWDNNDLIKKLHEAILESDATYHIRAVCEPEEAGTVTGCVEAAHYEDSVELDVTPAPGWRIVEWSDDRHFDGDHRTIDVYEDLDLVVYLEEIEVDED